MAGDGDYYARLASPVGPLILQRTLSGHAFIPLSSFEDAYRMQCNCTSAENSVGSLGSLIARHDGPVPVPHEDPSQKPGLAKLVQMVNEELGSVIKLLEEKLKPVLGKNPTICVTDGREQTSVPPLRQQVTQMSGRVAELRGLVKAIDL